MQTANRGTLSRLAATFVHAWLVHRKFKTAAFAERGLVDVYPKLRVLAVHIVVEVSG